VAVRGIRIAETRVRLPVSPPKFISRLLTDYQRAKMINLVKIDEKQYQAGFRQMIRRKYRLPDGRLKEYDIKNEGKSVSVLAMTSAKNIILAKQFRPGPEKILMELPGGGVDNGEKPNKAIKRELLEETGYTGKFHLVNTCWNCGYSNRLTYNFVATNCRKVQKPTNDENEFIEVVK
jgi:ADP-ribose pyrophosphatase